MPVPKPVQQYNTAGMYGSIMQPGMPAGMTGLGDMYQPQVQQPQGGFGQGLSGMGGYDGMPPGYDAEIMEKMRQLEAMPPQQRGQAPMMGLGQMTPEMLTQVNFRDPAGMTGLGSMGGMPPQFSSTFAGMGGMPPGQMPTPTQGAMGQSVGSLYGQQSGMGQPTAPTPPAFGQSTPSTAQTGIGQLFGQFQGQNPQGQNPQGQNPQAVAPVGAGIM